MDALTSTGRLFGSCDHEHRSDPGGSPCLLRPHFQPFCPQPPRHPSHGICTRSRFLLTVTAWQGTLPSEEDRGSLFPRGLCQGLRSGSAGSPVDAAKSGLRCVMSRSLCYGRVVHFRQLPTSCCHDAVAFGCRRVNVPPDGDFHPAVDTPPQAHVRGLQAAEPELGAVRNRADAPDRPGSLHRKRCAPGPVHGRRARLHWTRGCPGNGLTADVTPLQLPGREIRAD